MSKVMSSCLRKLKHSGWQALGHTVQLLVEEADVHLKVWDLLVLLARIPLSLLTK